MTSQAEKTRRDKMSRTADSSGQGYCVVRPTPRRTRLSFWILLILLAVMLPLLGAEIALRALYRDQDVTGTYWGLHAFEPDDVLGYRHAAGYRGRVYRSGVFDCPVEISAYGLRQVGVDSQIEYPRKILLLGDSFTFGLGVREESTFASLMQSSLNAEGIGVINAGQTGYSAEQEVMLGMRLASVMRPAVIILCLFLDNDIKDDYTGRYRNVEVKWGCCLSKDRRLPISAIDFLRAHSYLWIFVAHRLHTENLEKPPEVILISDFMRPTLDAVMKLYDYCQNSGIRLGIVLIPPRSGGTVFDAPFKEGLMENDLAVLDLSGNMVGSEGYFHIDGHWNIHGHERAAELLIPFTRSILTQGSGGSSTANPPTDYRFSPSSRGGLEGATR